jgi:hypothetical protein
MWGCYWTYLKYLRLCEEQHLLFIYCKYLRMALIMWTPILKQGFSMNCDNNKNTYNNTTWPSSGTYCPTQRKLHYIGCRHTMTTSPWFSLS